jgi:hypothetical protein
MQLIIDIPDSESNFFLKLLQNFSFVKVVNPLLPIVDNQNNIFTPALIDELDSRVKKYKMNLESVINNEDVINILYDIE